MLFNIGDEIMKLPSNEENLALLAVLMGGEIKVIDCVTTLIWRKTGSEIVVALAGATELVNHHLLLLNLEQNETVGPLCF